MFLNEYCYFHLNLALNFQFLQKKRTDSACQWHQDCPSNTERDWPEALSSSTLVSFPKSVPIINCWLLGEQGRIRARARSALPGQCKRQSFPKIPFIPSSPRWVKNLFNLRGKCVKCNLWPCVHCMSNVIWKDIGTNTDAWMGSLNHD